MNDLKEKLIKIGDEMLKCDKPCGDVDFNKEKAGALQ